MAWHGAAARLVDENNRHISSVTGMPHGSINILVWTKALFNTPEMRLAGKNLYNLILPNIVLAQQLLYDFIKPYDFIYFHTPLRITSLSAPAHHLRTIKRFVADVGYSFTRFALVNDQIIK
jgi:hypothetical protein